MTIHQTLLGLVFSLGAVGARGDQEWIFIRGDVNGDGKVAIGDALITMNYLFAGGPVPPCLDAGDFDDSGVLGLSGRQSRLKRLIVSDLRMAVLAA